MGINNKITSARGFTLIEIVVAVGIFAVISSLVFPGLMQFLNMRERLEEKQQEVIDLQKMFLFMSNDLQSMTTRTTKDEYGDLDKPPFEEDGDVFFSLITSYPNMELEGMNVPRKVLWQLQDKILSRIQFPVIDPDKDTRKMKQDMLKGVEKVTTTFHYHDKKKEKDESKWKDATVLPELVEVTIELQDELEYTRFFELQGGLVQK